MWRSLNISWGRSNNVYWTFNEHSDERLLEECKMNDRSDVQVTLYGRMGTQWVGANLFDTDIGYMV